MRELTNGRPLPCWVSCYLFTVLTGPTSHLLTSPPLPRPKRRTATWRDTWHPTTFRYKVHCMAHSKPVRGSEFIRNAALNQHFSVPFPWRQSRPLLSCHHRWGYSCSTHARLMLFHTCSLKVHGCEPPPFHSISPRKTFQTAMFIIFLNVRCADCQVTRDNMMF